MQKGKIRTNPSKNNFSLENATSLIIFLGLDFLLFSSLVVSFLDELSSLLTMSLSDSCTFSVLLFGLLEFLMQYVID